MMASGPPRREHGHGNHAIAIAEHVADQGGRRRHIARFADAKRHPHDEQMRQVLGKAGEQGDKAPKAQSGGNDIAPVGPVGQPGNRQAGNRIDNHEGRPDQKAQRRIGDRDIFLNLRQEQAEHVAIDRIEADDA